MRWIFYPDPNTIWCYEDTNEERYEIVWELDGPRVPQIVFSECNKPGYQFSPTFVDLPRNWIFV